MWECIVVKSKHNNWPTNLNMFDISSMGYTYIEMYVQMNPQAVVLMYMFKY